MKISELYGKQVESEDGKTKGYVLGVSCDGDRIEFLLCSDQNEKEFFIEVGCIKSVGEKIIYEDALSKLKRTRLLRLGKASYNGSGKFMGHFEDCECNDFVLQTAVIGKKKYDFNRLICGDVILIKDKDRAEKLPAPHEMFIEAICN